ncbi:tRNA lysidine(34) synthetase TilS [Gemmatimonadota bacterium]
MPLLDDTHIPKGSRIVVACSGGGDSVALLHLLADGAVRQEWILTVAHLDHGIRAESAEDAAFTERLAEGLGLNSVVERRDVVSDRRQGESVESAARRIRYSFLGEVRDRTAPGGLIATGHTLDDQLETIALRLERDAGIRGQRGILPLREDGVVRPLLGTRRRHLRQWMTDLNIDWCEDDSNLDPRYRRNLWRSWLGELPGDDYDILLEEADRLATGARFFYPALMGLARWWTGRSRAVTLPGEVLLERAPVGTHSSLLDQAILDTGLEECGLDPRDVPHRLREMLVGLWFGDTARGGAVRGVIQLKDDLWAERVGDDLLLARCGGPHWENGTEWSDTLDFSLPGRNVTLVRELYAGGTVSAVTHDSDQIDQFYGESLPPTLDGRFQTVLNITGTSGKLLLRYGRSGDTLRPFGMTGRKNLADLFTEERIPRLRRARLPVVEAEGTILWVAGVRTAEGARVGHDSTKAVTLQFSMSNT